ncbi:O-antigen ligase family protein [Sphingomonas sp. R647]|uniref:O-antigen ligase family protein n=1 Tax=Sphingomonas sp. R647 TaxID=2875233 RepID=UPI001CD21835|nr:O-antigen ligase family protein [Sphingomonas sp. R647]MCA1196346.1 O-antigen ligase family protein [Sphingomonas sp. R647]
MRSRLSALPATAAPMPRSAIAGAMPSRIDEAPAHRRQRTVCLAALWGFLAVVLIGTSPFEEWAFSGAIGAGDLLNQLIYLVLFALLLFGTGRLSRRGLLPIPLGLCLVLGYCAISILWAVDPLISARRLALAGLTVWICFRLTLALGPERLLRTLRIALIGLLVINFLVVFLTPYGVHPEVFGDESLVAGNWRGIIPHKNIAGAACAFTILLMVFDNRQFSRLVSAVVIVGALVFLYYSQAKTSQGILVLALALGWLARGYSPNFRGIFALLLVILVGLGIQLLSVNSALVRDMLNDPAMLTGRTAIWPLLLEYIAERPFTGAGFGSFWQIGDASPIWWLTSGWVARFAAHGHNGYLDLAATIGLPGMALAVAALLLWPGLRLMLSFGIGAKRRALLLALLTFCAGHNLTESSLLNGAAVVQVFLLFTIAIIYFHSDASEGAHQRIAARARRILGLGRTRGVSPPAAARVGTQTSRVVRQQPVSRDA